MEHSKLGIYDVFHRNDTYIIVSPRSTWCLLDKASYSLYESYLASNSLHKIDDKLAKIKLLEGLEENPVWLPLKSKHRNYLFEVTNKCNNSCLYCYQNSSIQDETHIDKEYWMNFIDGLDDPENIRLQFSGGEPLLYPYIKNLIEYSVSKGFRDINLITKGDLLDKEWIEFIKLHMIRLQISLDSIDSKTNDFFRGHGAYEKTSKSLNSLGEAGLLDNITISTVITKKNLYTLPEMIISLKEKGINKFNLCKVLLRGRYQNDAIDYDLDEEQNLWLSKELWNIKKKYLNGIVFTGSYSKITEIAYMLYTNKRWSRCCSYSSTFRIAASGDIFICNYNRNKFCVGSIIQNDLSHFERDKLDKTDCNKLYSSCEKCCWRGLCFASCLSVQKNNTANLDDCNSNKLLFTEILFEEADEIFKLSKEPQIINYIDMYKLKRVRN